MKMSPSRVCCALIPLFLLAPSQAHSQDKKGTVNVDSLEVYSEMSRESDVVTMLAKGTVVRVLLTVIGDGGVWCSITSQGASSRVGYVLCSGLDRPKPSETVSAAAENGPLPEILVGSSSTPVQSPKRQTHPVDRGALVGQTLAPLAGYGWGSYRKTLVIAIRIGCPYCDSSLGFYRQLGEQERSSMIRAHVLLVMPNDASTGGGYLRRNGVEVQEIFGQELDDLRVSGTPTLLLLDSSGRIEREWVGKLSPRGEKDVISAAGE